MKTKSIFLAILFAMTALSFQIQAQDLEDLPLKRDEIAAQKAAYFTQRLQLTPEESQVFWPHYNAYEKLLDEHRAKMKSLLAASRDVTSGLNEKEVDKRMAEAFATERKRIDIEESYYRIFKSILPIHKVAALYQVERDFRKELLRSLRNRPTR